jgi:DNA-binding CsgD family transcriptional regulator
VKLTKIQQKRILANIDTVKHKVKLMKRIHYKFSIEELFSSGYFVLIELVLQNKKYNNFKQVLNKAIEYRMGKDLVHVWQNHIGTKKIESIDFELMASRCIDPIYGAIKREERERLNIELDKLTERQKIVVNRLLKGYTQEEISRQLHVDKRTILLDKKIALRILTKELSELR